MRSAVVHEAVAAVRALFSLYAMTGLPITEPIIGLLDDMMAALQEAEIYGRHRDYQQSCGKLVEAAVHAAHAVPVTDDGTAVHSVLHRRVLRPLLTLAESRGTPTGDATLVVNAHSDQILSNLYALLSTFEGYQDDGDGGRCRVSSPATSTLATDAVSACVTCWPLLGESRMMSLLLLL